jgi:hypothetical protein
MRKPGPTGPSLRSSEAMKKRWQEIKNGSRPDFKRKTTNPKLSQSLKRVWEERRT